MKNLFTILLSCLMISLFLSCSMEPEQDFVENEKETFESLKMKVEAMAQEYGVGVSINEKVWRKRLPSIDDIEKDFIRIKELSATTRSNMDSTSVNQSYTSVFSNANTNISALENKPRVLKTSMERLPDTGDYTNMLFNVRDDDNSYDVETTVTWRYGGPLSESYVKFKADIQEFISSTGSYKDNTITETFSWTYNFTGNRLLDKGKSFWGTAVVYFRYYDGQNPPEKIFSVSTTYTNSTGIGITEIVNIY